MFLYSDNGGEFIKLKNLLSSFGIIHLTTPQHNRSDERRNHHVVETSLTLLHQVSIPLSYCSHAFHASVYLINRLPALILNNSSPFEALLGHSPNYQKLRIIGYLCFPWLRLYNKDKLEASHVYSLVIQLLKVHISVLIFYKSFLYIPSCYFLWVSFFFQ